MEDPQSVMEMDEVQINESYARLMKASETQDSGEYEFGVLREFKRTSILRDTEITYAQVSGSLIR